MDSLVQHYKTQIEWKQNLIASHTVTIEKWSQKEDSPRKQSILDDSKAIIEKMKSEIQDIELLVKTIDTLSQSKDDQPDPEPPTPEPPATAAIGQVGHATRLDRRPFQFRKKPKTRNYTIAYHNSDIMEYRFNGEIVAYENTRTGQRYEVDFSVETFEKKIYVTLWINRQYHACHVLEAERDHYVLYSRIDSQFNEKIAVDYIPSVGSAMIEAQHMIGMFRSKLIIEAQANHARETPATVAQHGKNTKYVWQSRGKAVKQLAALYVLHWRNEEVDLQGAARKLLGQHAKCYFGPDVKTSNIESMLKRLHHDAMKHAEDNATPKTNASETPQETVAQPLTDIKLLPEPKQETGIGQCRVKRGDLLMVRVYDVVREWKPDHYLIKDPVVGGTFSRHISEIEFEHVSLQAVA